MKDIFLSAGVPEPEDPKYGATADPLRIHAAVRALCLVVLGYRRIVWGGHPAITPMIWAACDNMGIDHAGSVQLYQSSFFPKEVHPKENDSFGKVIYTDPGKDLADSLLIMRKRMLGSYEFEAGIFIGGKQGVIDEFEMFARMHADAKRLILPSTGGAAAALGKMSPRDSAHPESLDFIAYLSEHIPIDLKEKRKGIHDG